jgi:sigma-B regulation protein RsbU (phosphoserine phosphatase)
MVIAPIPSNDSERVKNLESYQLLDTPFEAVFDEIASLAAKICGVPYALISLIDSHRQWFKAAHGFRQLRETSRDVSFCGHAIMQDEIFYIPDARDDERFHDNPFVTDGLQVRVYAGMPIKSEEGYNLGTLCVLSSESVPLSAWQKESLRQLSHVLTTLFSARRKEVRLAALGQVMDQLGDEIILGDGSTFQSTYANNAACRASGIEEKAIASTHIEDFLPGLSDTEKRQLFESLQAKRGKNIRLELKRLVQAADGKEVHDIEYRLQCLQISDVEKIFVIGHDISERKKLQQVQAQLQESLEKHHQELQQAYLLLSEEMMIARDMQLRFLPQPKQIGAARFDWLFKSSSYLGGDVFDYFAVNDRYVCFHVIDVSGHGLSAALLAFNAQRQMFLARAEIEDVIKRFGGQIGLAAEQIVSEFNRKFTSLSESSLYLTMVFCILDQYTGRVSLVQAGHPPPYLARPGRQEVEPIGDGGLPIGILDDAEYEAQCLQLEPGARLHLYSDGVPECTNPQQEVFGQEALQSILTTQHDASIKQVQLIIDQALVTWHGQEGRFDDDLTFLTVEFAGPIPATSWSD